MGKKITQLPDNQLPYDGNELVAIVESGETRQGTLSSLVSYLSGALYNNQYPLATPHRNNFFTATQTFLGSISASGGLVMGSKAETTGTDASVAGGCCNTASGGCSTVAGGRNNTASVSGTFIGGGTCNAAAGCCS